MGPTLPFTLSLRVRHESLDRLTEPSVFWPFLLRHGICFVNNLSGYIVEAEILDAPNCEGPVFDDVTLEAFEKGLCIFHRPARSSDDTARAVSLFDQAQVRGLPPVHQQFAALLTGLAHGSEAERHFNVYRDSDNQDLLSRTFFLPRPTLGTG